MPFGCWSTSYKSKVMRINMDNLSKSAKKKCSVRLPFSKVQTIPTSLHVYSYSHVLSDIYSSLFNVFLFISLRRLLSQTHFLLTQVWVRQHVRAVRLLISVFSNRRDCIFNLKEEFAQTEVRARTDASDIRVLPLVET